MAHLKIGLVTPDNEESRLLIKLIQVNAAELSHNISPDQISRQHIDDNNVDVWLLSVDDESWDDSVDELLDKSTIPVYFNEPGTLSKQDHPEFWCANLIDRLYEMTGLQKTSPTNNETVNSSSVTDKKMPLVDSLDKLDKSTTSKLPKKIASELVSELETLKPFLKEKTPVSPKNPKDKQTHSKQEKLPSSKTVSKLKKIETKKSSSKKIAAKKAEPKEVVFDKMNQQPKKLDEVKELDIPMLEDTASNIEFEESDQEIQVGATPCWVIGASLGGPAAVKRFIQCIPKEINASFIVAQHIDENFLPVLKEIITDSCELEVDIAQGCNEMQVGKVFIAPLKGKITFLKDGSMLVDHSQKWSGSYSPCINDVISSVAHAYGASSGAIIFSGMGEDGLLGAKKMREQGGLVWAQSIETCADPSMPKAIIDNNEADFVGSPEQLAENLVAHLNQQENKASSNG